MSLTYGFYNSLNGDRKYNAEQISMIFDGIINDGIFMSIGANFVVTANSGMTVNVGSGRAWFNHTWTYNDTILPLTLDLSELVLNRIDTVVLEINSEASSRTNSIKIIKGTPGSTPVAATLINTENLNQYPLARIYVGANVTSINQSNITNTVGTSETPFITGILETVDIDALIAQWQSEWDIWTDEQTNDFLIWFDEMKDQLSTDAAGHLQAQVDAINLTLATKEPTITAGTTTQYYRGDKSWQTLNSDAVGLGNVTNESKATMFTAPNFTGNATVANQRIITNDVTAGTAVYELWSGTQAQYDAIGTKDANTVYFIV